jgi:hypothetical protein
MRLTTFVKFAPMTVMGSARMMMLDNIVNTATNLPGAVMGTMSP